MERLKQAHVGGRIEGAGQMVPVIGVQSVQIIVSFDSGASSAPAVLQPSKFRSGSRLDIQPAAGQPRRVRPARGARVP
jgi:hypothetical protein